MLIVLYISISLLELIVIRCVAVRGCTPPHAVVVSHQTRHQTFINEVFSGQSAPLLLFKTVYNTINKNLKKKISCIKEE